MNWIPEMPTGRFNIKLLVGLAAETYDNRLQTPGWPRLKGVSAFSSLRYFRRRSLDLFSRLYREQRRS